jgi:hypothetical protein
MPIAEDIGPNFDRLSDDALDRIASILNRGIDVFDDETRDARRCPRGIEGSPRLRTRLDLHDSPMAIK